MKIKSGVFRVGELESGKARKSEMEDRAVKNEAGESAAIRLLTKVRRRLVLTAWLGASYRWFLVLAGVFAVGLLASRLSGYGAEWFNPWMAGLVPVLSLLGGGIFHRRPTRGDAARIVDRFSQSKDLFLAVSYLEGAAGNYQPLVTRAAETAAQSIRPQVVVPWEAWRPARDLGVLCGAIAAGLLWMPQMDPFGQIQASQQVAEQKKELVESRRLTAMRVEALKKDQESGAEAKESTKAVEALKKLLKAAKPQESKKNQESLAEVQKGLNQAWKKMDAGKLREMLNQGMLGQQFGEESGQQKKFMEDLKEGKTDELKKELSEIKKMAEELAKTNDPIKKQELERKLKKKLRDLQQFAEKKTSNKQMANALDRAMKQLEMATQGEKVDPQAMEALKESLELSEKELEELAKNVGELKNVEDAMKAAQMAQQLNRAGKLDGEKCEKCEGLADYEELLKELLAEMQEGEGMGERGNGRGDKAPENDQASSEFKEETSASAVKAGKMLMSLKSKGEGEKGESTQEYQNLVRSLKQQVTEAIQKEEIPPGYQESIKQYFEDLDEESVPAEK